MKRLNDYTKYTIQSCMASYGGMNFWITIRRNIEGQRSRNLLIESLTLPLETAFRVNSYYSPLQEHPCEFEAFTTRIAMKRRPFCTDGLDDKGHFASSNSNYYIHPHYTTLL